MEYTSLYRKYRPDTFDKMIGQDHIVRTLINQIKLGRIGHAYLFTGTRGTGKTSAAKIFAKAVNCLSPKDGSPCGQCEVCKAFKEFSNLDIIEIDAASNNSVDDIRELRDTVKYPPTLCKYKVYIIDEVHMLSTSAFNALLKTLEEPPLHVIFILATTEVQKLPQTVLSRCIRFDFRLIPIEKLSALIASVFDDMKKGYTKEAVDMIAEYGDGSARDALSIADMCLSYSTSDVTENDVLEVLGANDRDTLHSLSEAILKGNSAEALVYVNKIASLGKSVTTLASDLAKYLRNLIVVKNIKEPKSVLSVSDTQIVKMKDLASRFDSYRIGRAMHIMSSVEGELRYSTQQRIVFESAVVNASEMRTEVSTEGINSRVYALEKKFQEGISFIPNTKETAPEKNEKTVTEETVEIKTELKTKVKKSITEDKQNKTESLITASQISNNIIETEEKHFNTLDVQDKPSKIIGKTVEEDLFSDGELDDEEVKFENLKAKLIAYLKSNRAMFDFAMAVTDAEITRLDNNMFLIFSKETRIIELFSDERKVRIMTECVKKALGEEYGFRFIPITVKDYTRELVELFGDALKKI